MSRYNKSLVVFLIVSGSLVSTTSIAQTEGNTIQVGPNVHVSGARENLPHGEVFIAADPKHSEDLVGTSMIFPRDQNDPSTILYASFDSGKSWTPTLDGNQFAKSDDPAVAFGPDGALFFVVAATVADGRNYLAVYRSDDDGKTWGAPTLIPNDFEAGHRQVILADATSGKYHGRVYVVGTGVVRALDGTRDLDNLTVFYSTDGGRSFRGPVKRALVGDGALGGHVTCSVLSNGTLICLFGQLKPSGEASPSDQTNAWLKVITSSDGGESLSPAVTLSDYAMDQSNVANHASMLAVDPGNRWTKDRLYAVWPDRRSGRVEILLSKSEDNGRTWSTPHVVNDDRPFAGSAQGPDDFMPVVAVNKDGVVGVAWCDRRDNPDDLGWWIRFTASLDGGSTFLPSVRVSEAANFYGKGNNWNLSAVTAGGNTSEGSSGTFKVTIGIHPFHFVGGDYGGIVADAAGVFHPLWVDNRTGVPQVWTAAVVVRGTAIKHGAVDLEELRDISKDFHLELNDISYDETKSVVTLHARLRSASRSSLMGPLKVRVLSLQSQLGQIEVVNADNGQQTAGAVWDFTSVMNSNVLAPGETTRTKTLIFRVTDLRSLQQGNTTHFGLVNFEAQVLGKIPKRSGEESKE